METGAGYLEQFFRLFFGMVILVLVVSLIVMVVL